jgi:hypothetical protein
MFKSIIATALALLCGSMAAHAVDSDKQKQERTHQNIQTGIANTPVAQPPKASSGSGKPSTPAYSTTKTYSSPTRSGGGSSTSHNYNRPYNVPSPASKGDSKSK